MLSYLINLDRSPERLAFFAEQAQRAGLAFERISAVDGRALTPKQREAAVAQRFEFQPINAGEIGLFMSHRAVWQRIADSGVAYGAVFEDDAVLSLRVAAVLAGIDAQQPAVDVIKLETTGRAVVLEGAALPLGAAHSLRRLRSWHGGTAAYVVSRAGALALLQATAKLADPVDQVLFNPMSRVSSSLRLMQVWPAVGIQKNILESHAAGGVFGTTIDRHKSRRGLLFRHGLLLDARRAWKKLKERRRRAQLARVPGHSLMPVPFDLPDAQGDAQLGEPSGEQRGEQPGAQH